MRRGMTLIELLVVIGILVSLMALGAPWMFSRLDRIALDTAAERMGTMFQMARLNAMTEGTRYRIRYDDEEFTWQFQRKRLRGEEQDDEVEEEPEETDEEEFGFQAEEQPGYRPARQAWADMDAFLGARIRIRWVLSDRAYRRLEGEEPGQAVFTGGEEEDRLSKVVFEPDGSSVNFVMLIEQSDRPVTREQREEIEVEEEDIPEEGEVDHAYFRKLIFWSGMTGSVYVTRPQTARERANRVEEMGEQGEVPTYTPRDGVWGGR